jgi:hypothetical protein
MYTELERKVSFNQIITNMATVWNLFLSGKVSIAV